MKKIILFLKRSFVLFVFAVAFCVAGVCAKADTISIPVENIKPNITYPDNVWADNASRHYFYYPTDTTNKTGYWGNNGYPPVWWSCGNYASYDISNYSITGNPFYVGMDILINLENGDQYTISLGADETITIGELKEKVESLYGISFSSQTLEFDGEILDDSKTTDEYFIFHNSVVNLYVSSNPSPSNNSLAHVHEFVEGEIYSATKDKDGLGGIYCKNCGAIKESWPISAYGYSINDYATPMVNASKSGQTTTFEFGEWNSFPKAFMEKIAAKSAEGVSFVFHYKWNHVKKEIIIPAGTTVDLNFDWYGPAKMDELYGMN